MWPNSSCTVKQPTHGGNILDKVFTNRPDCFSVSVSKSLLKTKHLFVLVKGNSPCPHTKPKRVKAKLLDLRAHNIRNRVTKTGVTSDHKVKTLHIDFEEKLTMTCTF